MASEAMRFERTATVVLGAAVGVVADQVFRVTPSPLVLALALLVGGGAALYLSDARGRDVLGTDLLVVPDEELVEPVHLVVGPNRMACGAAEGIGVNVRAAHRVTCEKCKAAIYA